MMKSFCKKQIDWLVAGFLVVGFGLIYSFGSAAGVTGLADADEIVGVSILGGVVHPPGYAVLSSIIEVTANLFPREHQRLVVNTLAGWLQALTLGVLYLAGIQMLKLLWERVSNNWARVSSLFVVTALGMSYLFWLYAQVMEMVQLAMVMLSVIYMLSFGLIRKSGASYSLRWFLLWLVVSLGLLHQQALIFLIPGVFLVGYWNIKQSRQKPRLFSLALSGLLFGLVVSVVLLVIRDTNGPWSWRLNKTPNGVIDFILRSDFSGENVETGSRLKAYMKTEALYSGVKSLKNFGLKSLRIHLPLWLIVVFFVGLWRIGTRFRKNVSKFLLLNLLGSLALVVLLALPDDDSTLIYSQLVVLVERFYLLVFIPIVMISVVGVYWLLEELEFRVFKNTKMWMYILLVALGVMLVGFGFTQNKTVTNLSDNTIVDDWAENVLDKGKDGVILCFSDFSCFSLLNKMHLDVSYADAVIVPITPQIQQNSLDEANISSFNYGFNPNRIFDVIFKNLNEGNKVYVVEVDGYYIETLGMQSELLHLNPRDEVQEVSCVLDESVFQSSTLWSENLANATIDDRDSLQKLVRQIWAKNHEVNATVYGRMGKKSLAAEEIKSGLRLVDKQLVLTRLAQKLPTYPGDPNYQTTNVCRDAGYWLNLAEECENHNQECGLRYSLWASLVDQDDPEIKLKYANELEKAGHIELARIEYEKVLMIDPNNGQAMLKISQL